MNFSIAKQGDTVNVGIDGQLVVGNRQELKQLVLAQLERGERRFRIDFERTRYVDSSGLGVLVALAKKIKTERGSLTLGRLNADLRTLFQLTKLDTLFQFEDDGSADGAVPAGGGSPPPRGASDGATPREDARPS
jgi:anti-sigma B factor antagonist